MQRFRSIGVGALDPFDPESLDPVSLASINAGFHDAMDVISRSRGQVGTRGPTGWNTGTVGEIGFAYLRRAIQNFVGTGGNVAAEKKFFVTFEDGDGEPLDGAAGRYSLTFETLAARRRPLVADRVPGTTPACSTPTRSTATPSDRTTDGLTDSARGVVTILLQHDRPDPHANLAAGSRRPPSTSICGCGNHAPKRQTGAGCHHQSDAPTCGPSAPRARRPHADLARWLAGPPLLRACSGACLRLLGRRIP